MDLATVTILLVLALGVIAVVVLLTRGVFARDLTQALRRVAQQEQEVQAKADRLEHRLSQLEGEYQAKVRRGEQEAAQVIEEAKQQAVNIRTAAIEEAKHRARQLLLEAEQGRAHLREDVAQELNGEVFRQACAALRTFWGEAERQSVHHRLMEELLGAVEGLGSSSPSAAVEQVVLRTATPLSAEESARLTRWMRKALPAPVPLEASVDDTLIAGGILEAGGTRIDNSLATRLERAR